MSQRGPYAKGIAKRREIIDVTLDIVARRGWRQTSNAEIASRVGLSQAGLVHYYGTREELAIAVLQSKDQYDRQTFFDPNPTFEGFIDVITHNTTVPGLVQLYVECASEATIDGHAAREFFERRVDHIRALFAKIIENGQSSGDVGPDVDVPVTSSILMAAADGLQLQWLLDRSVDMAAQLRLMWDGICSHSWPDGSASVPGAAGG